MIFLSCLLITLYGQALYSSYNVYLTQGETYSLPMKELFKEQILNFTIKDCPDNVQLFKTLNLLSEQNNNQTFISISSSFPYYLLITQVNVLNLYQWNSTYVNLINQIELPQQTCLNALLTQEDLIIIDCYNLTNLNIYIYQKNAWTIIYSELIQQIPKKTDLKSFTSNSINSILYAQYYDDYEILTQFQFSQNLLYNISNLIKPFINFIVSNKPQSQNTVYIWDNYTLYQSMVNEYGLNYINIISEFPFQIAAIQIFNPQKIFYQCDTLLIFSLQFTYIIYPSYQYQICNEYAKPFNSLLNTRMYFNQNSSVFLSNEFLIVQQFDLIEIYGIIDLNLKLIRGLQLNSSFSQVSFDYNNNELFIFSDTQIVTYLVDYPNIKFQSDQNQSNYQFIIKGSPYQINQTDYHKNQDYMVKLNVSVLSINDNNIYLTHKINDQIVYTFQNEYYRQFILQFSGSLLTANFSVTNQSLGNFYDTTFQKIASINQSFQNLQFLNNNYAVGIINKNIFLIKSNNAKLWNNKCSFTITSQIKIKNNQIQGYYFHGVYFGVQINKKQLFLSNNCEHNQSYILTFQPFQQFYVLFQQIVLLLESNIIQICSFTGNCTNLQINNDINPVGIALNQQLYSSTLFINNNYSNIIVGQITSSNTYIILSQIDGKIQVQDMKIVNNRLILNYFCQQNQFICFQVWNIANLNSPFFEKNLRSIQNSNNIQLSSDNLFYYVRTNDEIYIYNPVILEHSSLFYTFNYNGSYFTTTTTQDMAIISFNSQFYQLTPILVYSYQTTIQNSITNDIQLWSNTYNVSVSSQIGTQNDIDYPQNQHIIIFNDFLDISLNTQTYNVSSSHVTLTSDNISFSGQVGWFDIDCGKKLQSQVINILTKSYDVMNYRYDIFAVFNQQILFIIQNSNYYLSSNLQICNITPEGRVKNATSQKNYIQSCLNELSQMNSQYIFLICDNLYNYSEFALFRINITNSSLGEMTYLTSINTDGVKNTILQGDILYLYTIYQITIYDINLNISQSIQTKCNLISFQPYVYQDSNSNYSYYANIYVCKDDEKIYYQLGKQYLQEQKQIQFISVKYIQIKDYFYFTSYIVGILIVLQYNNTFAMMCFTNQFSFIISLKYSINETDFLLSTLAFNRLLFYSPPIMTNNLYQFLSAVVSSGLVVVSYQNDQPFYIYYVLYNTSNLNFFKGNLENPFLHSAILNNTTYLQNIITFNSSYGFILDYNEQEIINSLKIEIPLQNKTTQCILTAYNLMNNATNNYIFNFEQQIDFGFEYALLAFLIVVFISALVLLLFKTKDQKEQFGLEEFEGLEIDTFQ